MATTQEMLSAINDKILDCVNNPKFDYEIGDKKVSWKDYLKWLKDQRASLLETQDVDIDTFTFEGFEVNEFGIQS
jgi:hypothetical protein